jgi:Spy/CpxP family protein refolding chaperone
VKIDPKDEVVAMCRQNRNPKWTYKIQKKEVNKMKKIIVTLVLIVGILATLSAYDGMRQQQGKDIDNCQKNMNKQHGKMQNNMSKQHGIEKGFYMLMEELELTENQEEQIEELKIAQKKSMIQLEAEIDLLKVDKHTAMKNHDFKELKKLTGKMFDLKKNIALKQVEFREAIWNVLTAEQQAKADEMKKEKHHFKMKNQTNMKDNYKMGMRKKVMLGTE